jgi:hypothetical protein
MYAFGVVYAPHTAFVSSSRKESLTIREWALLDAERSKQRTEKS